MCLGLALGGCCCAGATCCACFQSIFGTTFRQSIRLGYVLIAAALSLYLVLMLFVLTDWLSSFFILFNFCTEETSDGESVLTCIGVGGVYRMSLSLFVLFIFIALACLERQKFAKIVNEGCWLLKILFVLGLTFALNWVSNSFFDVYATVALWISLVYLFFQSTFLIDFSYRWSESWFEEMVKDKGFYKVASIFFTLLLYLGTATLIGLMFAYFWNPSCSGAKCILILSLLLVVIFTTLNLIQFNPSGSILGAGFMSFLIVFLLGSSLASITNETCNPFASDQVSLSLWQAILNCIWPLVACLYLTIYTEKPQREARGQTTGTTGVLDQGNPNETQEEENFHEAKKEQDKGEEEDFEAYRGNSYFYFFVFLAFMAVYISMLLSNWGTIIYANEDGNVYSELDSRAFYIKFCTTLAVALLYIWTLVAPRVLPDRNFSI